MWSPARQVVDYGPVPQDLHPLSLGGSIVASVAEPVIAGEYSSYLGHSTAESYSLSVFRCIVRQIFTHVSAGGLPVVPLSDTLTHALLRSFYDQEVSWQATPR